MGLQGIHYPRLVQERDDFCRMSPRENQWSMENSSERRVSQTHKEIEMEAKVKKGISFILVLVMCLSLCACTLGETNESVYQKKVERIVQTSAEIRCELKYGTVSSVQASVASIDNKNENGCDAKGYVTIVDAYGDTYKAKFSATVHIQEDGRGHCDPFIMGTPTK